MRKLPRHLLRLLPLILVIVGIWLVLHFGLNQYLSFEAIKTHKDLLLTWIDDHYFLSVLFFMLAYIIVVALSIPGAVFLTLTAGFLFGSVLGTIYVVIAATIGATCIFLIVQFSALTSPCSDLSQRENQNFWVSWVITYTYGMARSLPRAP